MTAQHPFIGLRDGLHPARLEDAALLRQCQVRQQARSGPGGQHRNKTSSGVFLRHEPTEIEGQATERRSAHNNQRVALGRLRLLLALRVRTKALAEALPTPLWLSRVHHQKLSINAEHEDFPSLLAEALEIIALRHGDLAAAAEQLRITPSQLNKFLKKEPQAWLQVAAWRAEHGLPALQ